VTARCDLCSRASVNAKLMSPPVASESPHLGLGLLGGGWVASSSGLWLRPRLRMTSDWRCEGLAFVAGGNVAEQQLGATESSGAKPSSPTTPDRF
jgi:hypothetical protein